MEKYYHFAGVEVAVRIPDEWMYEDDRQLAPFRIVQAKSPHILTFEPVDMLNSPSGNLVVRIPGMRVYREGSSYARYIGSVEDGWETAYIRSLHGTSQSHAQVKVSEHISYIGVKTVLSAMGAEHLVAQAGGFVFHCAYIDIGGKAILFTAPSGTGKSTQAELWRKYRGAEIINGDRAAVCVRDGVFAEGIPFCGSSSYCVNRTLPISAIVYLSQSPTTSIRKLCGVEAFLKIWEGVSVNTWDKDDMERVSGMVQQTAALIPIYHLACTPDQSAVIALEEALRKQETL